MAQPEVSKAFWAAATAASTSFAVKLRDGGEFFAGAGIVGFERRLVGAGGCFAADEGLLQFAVEEFAYFGNEIKCRRSHVSPRRMDADGSTF